MKRTLLRRSWLLLCLAALSGCPSPAAPPAPPAEIPSALTVPRDLSINVDELSGGSSGPALKLLTPTPGNVKSAIELSGAAIEEANLFLDISLSPVSQVDIPVSASLTTFEASIPLKEGEPSTTATFKFDFGRFDLDGVDGTESCTGCTCPAGCAPDLAVCPTEASEADLRPICLRVWLNGVRFLAALFDRVPTKENPQSGRLRVVLPSFADLGGSALGILYDHADPKDRQTALSLFLKDVESPAGDSFFANRSSFGRIQGPEETALKTARLTSSFLSPPAAVPGTLQFQSRYFSHLDFIALEVLADGVFGNEPDIGFFGLENITPPICAQITTSNPVSDVLCADLGLTLTPGDFLSPPVLEDTQLPPVSEFPEAPTF